MCKEPLKCCSLLSGDLERRCEERHAGERGRGGTRGGSPSFRPSGASSLRSPRGPFRLCARPIAYLYLYRSRIPLRPSSRFPFPRVRVPLFRYAQDQPDSSEIPAGRRTGEPHRRVSALFALRGPFLDAPLRWLWRATG